MMFTQVHFSRALQLLLVGVSMMCVSAGAQSGHFVATGGLITPRQLQGAVLLGDGKALVVGGVSSFADIASAELYDPAAEGFAATGSMAIGRQFCGGNQPVLLKNGKVLIVGGIGGSEGEPLSEVELYDPTAGVFTTIGSMHEARECSTATLLGDGTVLVAGGFGGNNFYSNTAEIFDPNTETFTYTASKMTTGRDAHLAALLPGGKVLIAGGDGRQDSLQSAEVYDPATGKFAATDSLLEAMSWPGMGLTLLNDGTVLVVGPTGKRSELYNPVSGKFTGIAPLTPVAFGYSTIVLKNGSVFVSNYKAYLYVPSAGTYKAAATLYSSYGSATVLRNGSVLVAGGAGGGSIGAIGNAGLYTPSGK